MDKREIKEMLDVKKDIAQRLRGSDKALWNKLPEKERSDVVETYYHLSDIENIGLIKALEDNRDLRRNLGVLIIGLILGVFGGMAGDALFRILPDSGVVDALSILTFGIVVWQGILFIDRTSVDALRRDGILKLLVLKVRENQAPETGLNDNREV